MRQITAKSAPNPHQGSAVQHIKSEAIWIELRPPIRSKARVGPWLASWFLPPLLIRQFALSRSSRSCLYEEETASRLSPVRDRRSQLSALASLLGCRAFALVTTPASDRLVWTCSWQATVMHGRKHSKVQRWVLRAEKVDVTACVTRDD